MPSQKNIDQVKELTDKLSEAKAVILADYAGLSVNEQAELRQKIKKAGGQFIVAKNRLFKLALKETKHLGGGIQLKGKKKDDSSDLPAGKAGVEKALKDVLQGPTSFLFAFEDEIGPTKALVEFSQEHELPKIKIGLLLKPEDRLLTLKEIEELAKLPTHEELIARLISTLNAPKLRFVNVLSGNLRKLTTVLKAISDKKSATLKH